MTEDVLVEACCAPWRNCHKLLICEKQFYISIHSPYACISESTSVHYDSDVFCMLSKWPHGQAHRVACALIRHTIRCLQLTLQAASTMCSDQGDSLLGKTPNMDLRHTGFWCPTTKRMNQNAEWSQSWAGQQTNCSLRGWLRFCGLLRYLPDDLAGVECCKARVVIAFYWGDFFSFSFFAKFDLVHQESLTAC